MIEKIVLPTRPPFDKAPSIIDGLKRVNFIFGPNGSGKTTISRLIYQCVKDDERGAIHWKDGSPTSTSVYNRDFVSRNFDEGDSVEGVFTIGEDAVEARNEVRRLTKEIEKDETKRTNAEDNLREAESERCTLLKAIGKTCWAAKKALPKSFEPAFIGFNGSSDKYRDRICGLLDDANKSHELPDLDELEHRAELVLDDSISTVEDVPLIVSDRLSELEGADILGKVVTGKQDIPIAALIAKLGNADWVSAGRRYITDDVCPFCQKHTIGDGLKKELEQFFDEEYRSAVEAIKALGSEYASEADRYIARVEEVSKSHDAFLDAGALLADLEALRRIVESNKSRIRQKAEQPRIIVELKSTHEKCIGIEEALGQAAERVREHNLMVTNREAQKQELKDDIWRYAALSILPQIESNLGLLKKTDDKIRGLRDSVANAVDRINENSNKRSEIERNSTNAGKTAETINRLLAQFGFVGFQLVVTDDGMSYQVKRENGELASETLSEGERSFLTFLYFYFSLEGSQTGVGTEDKRVVVIDDPITSMDANVLFIVSSLVRKLAKDARTGKGKTDQLIVLTHNITFHREVTYEKAGEGNKSTNYYRIWKHEGHSSIECCEKNPVSSTYEMLWQDLYRDDCSCLTAQNTARRIVETFSRFVGNLRPDGLIEGMTSSECEIARSFLSWANAGSHSPYDDETYQNTHESSEVYRHVLENILKQAGYTDHCMAMISKANEMNNVMP